MAMFNGYFRHSFDGWLPYIISQVQPVTFLLAGQTFGYFISDVQSSLPGMRSVYGATVVLHLIDWKGLKAI